MLPFIFFSLNIENVRECCKAHWVCVDQRIALYKNYLLLLLSVFECKQVCVQHWACLQQVLTLLPWFSWTKKIKCFEEAGSFKLLPEFVDIFVAHFVVVTTHAVRCVCVCVCVYVCMWACTCHLMLVFQAQSRILTKPDLHAPSEFAQLLLKASNTGHCELLLLCQALSKSECI